MYNAVLFILACLLYILAPKQYNEPIIIVDLALFILGSVRLLRREGKQFNVLSFNFIFLLSFFFCTYSYALFVLGTGVEFSMTIFSYTNFDYITKGVSLSTMAITAYFLSYNHYEKKRRIQTTEHANPGNAKIKSIAIIRRMLALCVVINTIMFLGQDETSASITTASFIPELYKVFLVVYLILQITSADIKSHDLKTFIKLNKSVVFESALLCFLYLIVGDRGLPISIVFIYLGVYSFYFTKIRLVQFAVLGVIGAIFLYAIRVTRASDNSFSNGGVSSVASATTESLSGKSAILIFSDLMGASCELCLGCEYVDKFGHKYPGKAFLIPLQPIPFLPSAVARIIWNKVPYDMAASSILNDYIGRNFGYTSSLGNHIVTDIYMHWGILGVVILFLIFGRGIAFLDKNKYVNIFVACSYVFAISYALYLPRDSMFTLIRPIFFIWIIYKFFRLTNTRSLICDK